MSGANGVNKYALTDRNGALNPLVVSGIEYRDPNYTTVTAVGNPMIVDRLFENLRFDAATPNALNFGTLSADDVTIFLSQNNATGLLVGDEWTIHLSNTDAVAKTITFPSGFTPASVIIPPNSVGDYTFSVTAIGPPAAISLINSGVYSASTSTFPTAPTAQNDDLLVYDSATSSWLPSSVHTTGQITSLFVDNLNERGVLGNPIVMNGGLNATAIQTEVTPYRFQTNHDYNPDPVNSSIFTVAQIGATPAPGKVTNAIFRAEISKTNSQLVGDISPIICTNIAAVAAPYTNNVVFRIESDGKAFYLSQNLWSDARAKEDIQLYEPELETLDRVNAHTFNFLHDKQNKVGVIAQELREVFPKIVTQPTIDSYLSVDSLGLTATLLALMKKMKAKMDLQHAEMEQLKARVIDLEAK